MVQCAECGHEMEKAELTVAYKMPVIRQGYYCYKCCRFKECSGEPKEKYI